MVGTNGRLNQKVRPKILVVEDEYVVSLDIQTRLIRMGYDVAGSCNSGEEAIVRAAQIKPDLLLMDIMLAGKVNGITAAQRIRSQRDVPVIFLTAYSDDTTLHQASFAEPAGFIVKPFDERTLKTTIEITLARRRLETQRASTVQPAAGL